MYDDLLTGVHSATVSEVWVLVREVRVRIGVLSKPVSVRIFYDSRTSEHYRFELSARMKTASEHSACDLAGRTAASEGEALRRAVRMLTQDYEEAVRRGHLPDDTWLVDGETG